MKIPTRGWRYSRNWRRLTSCVTWSHRQPGDSHRIEWITLPVRNVESIWIDWLSIFFQTHKTILTCTSSPSFARSVERDRKKVVIKLMSVFLASVLLLIIILSKYSADPLGYCLVDLTTLCRILRSITGQTHEKLTSICFFEIANGQIVRSRSLAHLINYKFMCLSAYWLWKLAN